MWEREIEAFGVGHSVHVPEAVGEAALDFGKLRFDRRVEVAAGALEQGGAALEAAVGDELRSAPWAAGAPVARERRRRPPDGPGRDRPRVLSSLFERGLDQAEHGFRIGGQLPVQNAAGDGDGQLHHVALGLVAQLSCGGRDSS